MSEETKTPAGANASADKAKEAAKAPEKSAAEIKLEKELEAAKAIISKQNDEMNKLSVQVGSRHKIVTVDGENYRSLAKGKIIIGGKPIDADELNENIELVRELIAKGSGLFIQVKEAGKAKKGGKK